MNTDEITNAVAFLLESAHRRDTRQGVAVYERVLEMLADSSSDQDIADIVGRLNRSLVGMEAHGDFTDEEFARVRFLRTIEC